MEAVLLRLMNVNMCVYANKLLVSQELFITAQDVALIISSTKGLTCVCLFVCLLLVCFIVVFFFVFRLAYLL